LGAKIRRSFACRFCARGVSVSMASLEEQDPDGSLQGARVRSLLANIEALCGQVASEVQLLECENSTLRAQLGVQTGQPHVRGEDWATTSSSNASSLRITTYIKRSSAQPIAMAEALDECPPWELSMVVPVPEGDNSENELLGCAEAPCFGSHRPADAQPSEVLAVPELAQAWSMPSSATPRRASGSESQRYSGAASTALCTSVQRAGEAVTSAGYCQKFIFRPNSRWRICWDLVCIMVMLYDLVTIPLQAFEWEHIQVWSAIGIITTVLWTADIFVSFVAGYNRDGLVEMRPKQVALYYMRTWFPVDLSLVSVDWAAIAIDTSLREGYTLMHANETVRIVRLLRYLRLLRLLRVLKIWTVLIELKDMVRSETLLTCLSVSQLMFGILLGNHYIACSWYGIGAMQISDDPQSSWVSKLRASRLQETGVGYFYATALHWSLTQFTPASMEIVPTNCAERVFNIFVVLLALVLFSSILSSITSSMIHLRKLTAERRQQVVDVRRYIMQKRLTLDLGNRITSFLRKHDYNCVQNRVLHEEHIKAFKILPESLRTHLRCQVFLPRLDPHPLFSLARKSDEALMVSIGSGAMSEMSMAVGQDVFDCGGIAKQMYISIAGSLHYFFGEDGDEIVEVDPGDFISEAALWVSWEHRGRLVATCAAELVALNAAAFQGMQPRFGLAGLFREYAKRYQQKLVESIEHDGYMSLSDIGKVDAAATALAVDAYRDWAGAIGMPRTLVCKRLSTERFAGQHATAPSRLMSSIARFVNTRGRTDFGLGGDMAGADMSARAWSKGSTTGGDPH